MFWKFWLCFFSMALCTHDPHSHCPQAFIRSGTTKEGTQRERRMGIPFLALWQKKDTHPILGKQLKMLDKILPPNSLTCIYEPARKWDVLRALHIHRLPPWRHVTTWRNWAPVFTIQQGTGDGKQWQSQDPPRYKERILGGALLNEDRTPKGYQNCLPPKLVSSRGEAVLNENWQSQDSPRMGFE